MRFLVDQDIYGVTVKWLMENDQDVITAKDLDLQRAPDLELLRKAAELDRVLITRDKDFGSLLFLREKPQQGVIRLAIDPTTIDAVHGELDNVLENHESEELKRAFCVVEPGRVKTPYLLVSPPPSAPVLRDFSDWIDHYLIIIDTLNLNYRKNLRIPA